MTDDEQKLARRISAIWGHPGRVHPDARDLAKTLILDGWRAPVASESDQ